MEDTGFIDTYRQMHPTVTEGTGGFTWTTTGQNDEEKASRPGETVVQKNNLFCRIDFVYVAGDTLRSISSKTITHHASNKDRSFPEFPSDHGAVLTIFQLKNIEGEQ